MVASFRSPYLGSSKIIWSCGVMSIGITINNKVDKIKDRFLIFRATAACLRLAAPRQRGGGLAAPRQRGGGGSVEAAPIKVKTQDSRP